MNEKLRVVIIDDDEQSLLTLSRALTLYGCETVAFTNPLKAIEQIKRTPPDVVLTDFRMPQKNGYEVLVETKKISSSIRVLVFTGFFEKRNYLKCLYAGADNFITKPIKIEKLMQELSWIEIFIKNENRMISENNNQNSKMKLTMKQIW